MRPDVLSRIIHALALLRQHNSLHPGCARDGCRVNLASGQPVDLFARVQSYLQDQVQSRVQTYLYTLCLLRFVFNAYISKHTA